MNFYKEHGFLVDMGRWHKVASPEKVIHAEVGYNWQVSKIEPLDSKGRRFLVKAKYVEPEVRTEVTSSVREILEEPKKPEPVMGVDIFSKTQMRKVQAMLDEEHIANRTLTEELSKEKDKNAELMAQLKNGKVGVIVKEVKPPKFAKEKKAQESEFSMLRNCVMTKLSMLERFDSNNIRHTAEACGLKERGLDGNKFVRSTVASLTRLGHIELAGERNGKKTYRLTQKGLDYLKEVRQ